ncbi:MAG: hypothetical protein ABSA02_13880 [Trebonia sp.]
MKTMSATIQIDAPPADPAAELRWTSSLPGIISGEHSFVLTPADGGTRLVQAETVGGILAAAQSAARTETSFQALNQALKARAEEGASRGYPAVSRP